MGRQQNNGTPSAGGLPLSPYRDPELLKGHRYRETTPEGPDPKRKGAYREREREKKKDIHPGLSNKGELAPSRFRYSRTYRFTYTIHTVCIGL